MFDSGEVEGAGAPCLEGTQRHILRTIQDWAESPTGEVIFWLHGMAGTGKTSIALTVANALNAKAPFAEGCGPLRCAFLGASFFFKQGDNTRDTTKMFFTTIARGLAKVFPNLRTEIASAVEKNLEIGTKAPQQQLDRLVFGPLSVLDKQTFIPARLVVVVDALDECENQREVDDLIGMLSVLQNLHQVQLRVLILSRGDDHIHKSFENLKDKSLRDQEPAVYREYHLNKVPPRAEGDGEVDDIMKYLDYALGKIADKNRVPRDWICQDCIAELSRKADGLFIYAATMCRFLDFHDFGIKRAREERLNHIFADAREMVAAPQQMVDEIYLKVLSFPGLTGSSEQTKGIFYSTAQRALGFIVVFFKPVPVSTLGALLPPDTEELDPTLRRLHSVLDVRQNPDTPLGLIHLSFRDFLLNEERSSKLPFRVEEISMHREVFVRCLTLMSEELRQDLCEHFLPGSNAPRSQVEKSVPRYLQYACRHWVDHLSKLDADQRKAVGLVDNGAVHVFLMEKLLFWMEAMGLIREAPTVILILNLLETLVDVSCHAKFFLRPGTNRIALRSFSLRRILACLR